MSGENIKEELKKIQMSARNRILRLWGRDGAIASRTRSKTIKKIVDNPEFSDLPAKLRKFILIRQKTIKTLDQLAEELEWFNHWSNLVKRVGTGSFVTTAVCSIGVGAVAILDGSPEEWLPEKWAGGCTSMALGLFCCLGNVGVSLIEAFRHGKLSERMSYGDLNLEFQGFRAYQTNKDRSQKNCLYSPKNNQ